VTAHRASSTSPGPPRAEGARSRRGRGSGGRSTASARGSALEPGVSLRQCTDLVAPAPGRELNRHTVPAQTVSRPSTRPRSAAHSTDDDGGVAEGAMVPTMEFAIRRPPPCAANPCAVNASANRLHCRAQRSGGVARRHLQGERAPYSAAHFVGDLLGFTGSAWPEGGERARRRASRERRHEAVVLATPER